MTTSKVFNQLISLVPPMLFELDLIWSTVVQGSSLTRSPMLLEFTEVPLLL